MIWREHVTLLHPSTTSVLLSLAALGSVLAQEVHLDRLVLFLAQIFLGGGVAANHFDEIVGRPWHTKISTRSLWFVALTGLSAFVVIGLYLTMKVTYNFIFFVIAETFFIIAYDLEIFDGIFHNPNSLGISWGLVFLGGYYLQDQALPPLVVITFLIICICAIQGIGLYERGKSFGKDRSLADPEAKAAWQTLQIVVLASNAIALTIVIYRFWLLQF